MRYNPGEEITFSCEKKCVLLGKHYREGDNIIVLLKKNFKDEMGGYFD